MSIVPETLVQISNCFIFPLKGRRSHAFVGFRPRQTWTQNSLVPNAPSQRRRFSSWVNFVDHRWSIFLRLLQRFHVIHRTTSPRRKKVSRSQIRDSHIGSFVLELPSCACWRIFEQSWPGSRGSYSGRKGQTVRQSPWSAHGFGELARWTRGCLERGSYASRLARNLAELCAKIFACIHRLLLQPSQHWHNAQRFTVNFLHHLFSTSGNFYHRPENLMFILFIEVKKARNSLRRLRR